MAEYAALGRASRPWPPRCPGSSPVVDVPTHNGKIPRPDGVAACKSLNPSVQVAFLVGNPTSPLDSAGPTRPTRC